MTTLKEKRFDPRPAARQIYDELYAIYRQLHDAFGGVAGASPALGSATKRFLEIKAAAMAASERRERTSGAQPAAPFDVALGVEGENRTTTRRASEAVGESEGQSPSENQ
jgi:L-ribulokinase